MKILVIDVGGTNVKVLATAHSERIKIPSGRKMTAEKMRFVFGGRPIGEPANLGRGWVGFNFRLGKKKWRANVEKIVTQLKKTLDAEYVVLGGGNAKLLKKLPSGTRLGDNENAFAGGYRVWENPSALALKIVKIRAGGKRTRRSRKAAL